MWEGAGCKCKASQHCRCLGRKTWRGWCRTAGGGLPARLLAAVPAPARTPSGHHLWRCRRLGLPSAWWAWGDDAREWAVWSGLNVLCLCFWLGLSRKPKSKPSTEFVEHRNRTRNRKSNKPTIPRLPDQHQLTIHIVYYANNGWKVKPKLPVIHVARLGFGWQTVFSDVNGRFFLVFSPSTNLLI